MTKRHWQWLLPPAALVLLALAGALARPELARAWNPWAPLAVGDPVTPATRFKLARAGRDPGYCRAALATAPLRTEPMPDGSGEAACTLQDAVRVTAGDVRLNSSFPASCRLALAYAMFERHDLQQLAQAQFGQAVTQVSHLGSYACAPTRGDAVAADYARADALDIAGVILADGRQIAVKRDWNGGDARAAYFLHALRDAACRSFGTVLGPDSGAAHAGHLHLAMRDDGRDGGSCR